MNFTPSLLQIKNKKINDRYIADIRPGNSIITDAIIDLYKFLRRFILLGFIIFEIIAQALLVVTIVAVLAQFGVNTTSIIAVLGAAGLAIGLALQGTLSNVAAGVMLLFLRPFKVGNWIEATNISQSSRSSQNKPS